MAELTSEEQLRLWVAGESLHRGDRDSSQSECCPDFSCCRPQLQQPPEVREAFARSDARGRDRWLMVFLGAVLSGTPAKVRIVGSEPELES